MSQLQLFPAFAVPMATATLEGAEQLNPQLKKRFFELEQAGFEETHTPTTRVNIFESNMDLFTLQDPPLQQLRQFCLSSVMSIVASTTRKSADEMRQLKLKNHAWFHITRKHGYIAYHNHPLASWSAVYYVDVGEANPDYPESGQIRFFHPSSSNQMFMDAGNTSFSAPFHQGTLSFEPKAGQLLIFPSYLMHEVAPFMGEGERICVAMNCWFE
ncbi:TIGR02466 family protein [Ferrimonas sp. SCSIO 43195]|uniref:TIGR02466 family protein n=1 Tax=Ferrimonas sp. SCSIO 43195 TaxID=2822844 RepID=UPI0020751B8B|nr:TIGR02466 family protein [Ferrimonas sp. SCSIO 43195]USD36432.1 2OG-Fe(II) oxygenase family protein [Ferrimonas sp. SCSIO 43195]